MLLELDRATRLTGQGISEPGEQQDVGRKGAHQAGPGSDTSCSAICLLSSNIRGLRFSAHTLGWGRQGASSSRKDLGYKQRQDPEGRKDLGKKTTVDFSGPMVR